MILVLIQLALCNVYIHGAYPGDCRNIHDTTAGMCSVLKEDGIALPVKALEKIPD